MSTLCKVSVRKLDYPLPARIVELAAAVSCAQAPDSSTERACSDAEALGRQEFGASAETRRSPALPRVFLTRVFRQADAVFLPR